MLWLIDRAGRYLSRHVEDDTLPVGWAVCIGFVVVLVIALGSIAEIKGWIDLI